MSIRSIYVGNFKGVSEPRWISLRPLTLFIGANSSGKSSGLHALACLAQTVKLSNSTRPIILDDEYADVHLGRFIEVIHTKSYKEVISLGVRAGNSSTKGPQLGIPKIDEAAEIEARYSFGCTLRTQDLSLKTVHYQAGKTVFEGSEKKGRYQLSVSGAGETLPMVRSNGFLLTEDIGGIVPGSAAKVLPHIFAFRSAQARIQRALEDTLYLGPFRQPPQRRYPTRGSSPRGVGALGEATATLLANEVVQSQARPHIDQVAKWLRVLELAKDVAMTRIGRSDLFEINLTLRDGRRFPIADLGYGLSQVLPVLVQCAFAPAGGTLLFEQPELHLHSLAAGGLIRVFADTIKKQGCTIVAETHAPELVAEVCRAIRSGSLSVEDVAVYRVSRHAGASRFDSIEIDDEGDVYEHWNRGISVPE